MKRQVACRIFKETPGAFRYREVDRKGDHIKGDEEGALVGDLYLRKAAVSGKAPDKITVTIEY
jgi:hypothetical protein